MGQSKVAYRYAKALFDLAIETGKVDQVHADLKTIQQANHKELYTLLSSPVIGSDKKTSIFEAVFAQHVQSVTVSFFKLIFHKGRAVAIKEIIEAYFDKYRAYKGIKVVEMTTAVSVSDEVRQSIVKELQQNNMLSGKSIELKEKVDASIIGGLVLQVDDKLFDASIKHDLQFIKKQFIKNMYVSQIK
jgi:F-type H+-transporting ATPase subunit delta